MTTTATHNAHHTTPESVLFVAFDRIRPTATAFFPGPSEFADMLHDNFDEMLEQSAHQPLVCPISPHPFVVGRPSRIRQLRRVFEHMLRYRERIWLTRPRDICAYIESLPRKEHERTPQVGQSRRSFHNAATCRGTPWSAYPILRLTTVLSCSSRS